VTFGTGATPVRGEQLLYRTTGQLGEPTVTVTTILRPTPITPATSIVEYLSFYDGLASKCDPSYTLEGGNPGSVTEQQAEEEELLVSWYLSNGFTVTVPDFEGTALDWMAGRESGYGALDALKATESYLHAPSSTPLGLSGYSGGAVAADWASELAPAYAPTLRIVGIAEGGIPVDYSHMIAYMNGSSVFSAAIPGMLLGLARAYHADLTPYLSAYGQKVVDGESNTCIDEDFGGYPGLTVQALMKPQYRSFFDVPFFQQILGAQRMGTAGTHPQVPLFMAVGNSDGTGDGAMVAADVKSLARQYCDEGVPVEFQEYTGASHEDAGAFFEPQTGPFLQARVAGAPFVGNCASIK
jgi:secretory lipase